VAEAVGARTLNVHLPFRVQDLSLTAGGRRLFALPALPVSENQRAYRRWLTEGGLAAQQAGTAVTIAVENLPVRRLLGRRVNVYALNTWEALAAFPRVCLDTTHCGTTGADLLAVYDRLAARVVHVHLSDYSGRYQHQPVGKGHLPLGPFLERLRGRGYGGIVVVELTPWALPVQDERRLAAELRRNLAFCRRHLAGAAAAAAAAAAGDGAAAPPAAAVPS
jgi:sugar phosphate isomerase/epimerase